MTRARKKKAELRVFESFRKACGLGIIPSSIETRDPPHPDIHCRLESGEPRAFELVELVDKDLARGFGDLGKLERTALDEIKALGLQSDLQNALVGITLDAAISTADKHQHIVEAVAILGTIESDFEGFVKHKRLPSSVSVLHVTRGWEGGPRILVHSYGAISDPAPTTIMGKFAKRYVSTAPIELVAYFSTQPPLAKGTWENQLAVWMQTNLESSPFQRVWVVELEPPSIIIRVPA